ncbi:MAG: hypothetical protein DWQ19_12910 [Crenarchaeota archaeon]|nr:MAG: hypothetical protein DWQ19_12910 [Thermoproteota archaeon]
MYASLMGNIGQWRIGRDVWKTRLPWSVLNQDWSSTISESQDLFRRIARNGDQLIVKTNIHDDIFYVVGFFHGKGNSHKKLIQTNFTAQYRREIVFETCGKIGDQSKPETLAFECIKLLYQKEKITVPFERYEVLVQDLFDKPFLYQTRIQWRKSVGSTNDCRTYNGQPERDMVLAAA